MTLTPRYSRDLIGYGPRSPLKAWPGGAKIAVQIVLNYEEGGEYSLEHGDAQSEAFLSDVIGATNWPGQRHWNIETMYDYGARVGFWRLHRVLSDLPVTVFGVTSAMARGPEQVRAMRDAGWEIASHGLRWIEYKDFSEADERAHMTEAIELHRQITGARPRGWYTGRASMNTINLATEEGGFDWVADSYADDLPYWHHHAGRDQLVMPYTLDANDARFIGAQGFSNGEDYFIYLRDVFDTMREDGIAGHPKIMSLGLHCRLAGKPGRLAGLKRFLAHAQAQGDVWFATRGQIAAYWRDQHPPAEGPAPHQMDRDAFVAAYGDVYEHSPWVTEHAHRLELGAAHSTALGLAGAMARAFRAAPEDKRLAVLQAHPDLAGKLAAAKRLTDASTAEQASAGLDALTDAERETFTRLNTAYTEKFGFPFIIAVRDNTKDSIMAAFERRVRHDRDTEFHEACEQVVRIAELRLSERLP
ncbi:MAG: allantoinase PuuE [Pseudomonadota bacterium]